MLKSLNWNETNAAFHNVAKLAGLDGSGGIIFHSLSVVIPTNRCVAILGRQESGRTTLLRMLARHVEPDAGILASTARFSMLLNTRTYFDPAMTGIENIQMLSRVFSLDSGKMTELILMLPGLQPKAWYEPVDLLDTRVRKSMEMLVAAVLPFDCFLLDDIDKVDQSVAATLIRMVQARGAGVIFTTFRPRAARPFADCACVIANRKVHFFETLDAAETFYGR